MGILRGAAVLVTICLGVAGCSVLQGDSADEAIRYVNQGIAATQCIQKAIKTETPELGTTTCLTHWFPEVTKGGPAATIAADTAACVRGKVVAAKGITVATDYQSALIQGAGDCAAQYLPKLIEAIRAAVD